MQVHAQSTLREFARRRRDWQEFAWRRRDWLARLEVGLWLRRASSRRRLRALGVRDLRDIGVSEDEPVTIE